MQQFIRNTLLNGDKCLQKTKFALCVSFVVGQRCLGTIPKYLRKHGQAKQVGATGLADIVNLVHDKRTQLADFNDILLNTKQIDIANCTVKPPQEVHKIIQKVCQ